MGKRRCYGRRKWSVKKRWFKKLFGSKRRGHWGLPKKPTVWIDTYHRLFTSSISICCH